MKNKMIDLHNALFAELEALQDEESFYDEDGKLDKDKAELAIKKADAVNNVAGKIMDLARLQLDAIKTARVAGMPVKMPETFGIMELEDGNERKTLGTARR